MDLGLKGRLALVTGSTRGLGKAIAMALAQEGVEIIINGRHKESVLKTMKEISDRYRVQTWSCPVDVTDNEAIKTYFELGPIAAKGSLDILVNNAGSPMKFGRFMDLSDDDWQGQFDISCMSMVRFSRHAIPFLKESKHGRIINISTVSSHQPWQNSPHYACAKAAMNTAAKFLANSLGQYGITVNTICPSTLYGGIWDQNILNRSARMGVSLAQAEADILQEEKSKNPLDRIGTLEDVANLVVHLSSDKASFTTGQIHNVDGGLTRGVK